MRQRDPRERQLLAHVRRGDPTELTVSLLLEVAGPVITPYGWIYTKVNRCSPQNAANRRFTATSSRRCVVGFGRLPVGLGLHGEFEVPNKPRQARAPNIGISSALSPGGIRRRPTMRSATMLWNRFNGSSKR
jgi:hypothetical protein